MAEKPVTIFVAGYFGFEIIGDDAILEGMLHDWRSEVPGAQFVLTSRFPDVTAARYGVRAVHFSDMRGIVDAIQSADLALVGGGGVFNEYSPYQADGFLTPSQEFNVFCASIPVLAAALGKPCMIYAVGVEPLYSESAKEHVRTAFRLADVTTVRDFGSLEVLKSIGAPVEKVQVTADPAVNLPVPQGSFHSHRLTSLKPSAGEPLIGVSLRHWNTEQWDMSEEENPWEAEVAQAFDAFSGKHGGRFLFVPFQSGSEFGAFGNDVPILERIRDRMQPRERVQVVTAQPSPAEMSAMIGACDLFVCTRFHSVILSVKNQTPCIAIAYSLKIKSAMERAGLQNYYVDLKQLTAGSFSSLMEECYQKRCQTKEMLFGKAKEWHSLALENVRLGKGLIGRAVTPVETLQEPVFARELVKLAALVGEKEQQISALMEQKQAAEDLLRSVINSGASDFSPQVLKLLEIFARNEPENPLWSYYLGFYLHAHHLDLPKAMKCYDLALQNGFEKFWVYYNRGALFLEMDDVEAARSDIIKALTINPTHSGAREVMGKIRARFESLNR